jgi:hypothetical protein
MQKFNEYQKIVAILLATILMLEFSGCYTLRGIPKGTMQSENKNYLFVHGQNSSFRISNYIISKGVISGRIDNSTIPPQKKQSVNIFIAPDSVIKINGDNVNIPFENVAKVEVYKIDGAKTTFLTLGILTAVTTVVFLIFLLTKGASCPFIYSDDGSNKNFEGEIYSGATAVPLERDDYLPLSSIKPSNGIYRLRITNEVNEIQNTNLAELVVIDHQQDAQVLMDKYGSAYSISDIKKPIMATDSYGNSILKELTDRDSLRYISSVRKDQNIIDTISLTFNKPEASGSGKLVISGKNTMWLDYMFGRFSDLFGNRFEKWKEKRDQKPKEELLKWFFDQGMPLAVYLQTENGLKFIDYFNLPGPMADKEDILQIDLSEVHSDKVNLKLVTGVLFWDIDFAGMDFTSPGPLDKTIVPLSSAVDEKGKNVTSLLANDDEKYLVQPLPVNKTDLSYPSPEFVPGMSRSLFLHSKGHYEILRETRGKPDIEYLKTFLEPGSFIKFSKNHFLEYYYKAN